MVKLVPNKGQKLKLQRSSHASGVITGRKLNEQPNSDAFGIGTEKRLSNASSN